MFVNFLHEDLVAEDVFHLVLLGRLRVLYAFQYPQLVALLRSIWRNEYIPKPRLSGLLHTVFLPECIGSGWPSLTHRILQTIDIRGVARWVVVMMMVVVSHVLKGYDTREAGVFRFQVFFGVPI